MYEFLTEGMDPNTLGQGWKRPRKRPRVLLGVAATGLGYALGGLPGAAVGAAASYLARKLDETRVG